MLETETKRLARAGRFSLRGAIFSALLCSQATFGAESFPGGFVEKSYDPAVRNRVTQLSFVPAGRGPFTFPAPYNTGGVRLTVPSDCANADCVEATGYSYWTLMNNHVGSNSMYVILNLAGHGGPTLFSYDKTSDAVTKVGPLFDSGPFTVASTEGWYFSASQATKLYVWRTMDSKLQRYDVTARTFHAVFDLDSNATLFGANRYLWQAHSSADDNVHSFTVRDRTTYAELGCGVYREDVRQFLFYPTLGDYDECQIDKSGRWLLIKENVDGLYGEDNRIIDVQAGVESRVLDQDGAGGHSDSGHGYMLAADNWAPVNFSVKLWQFGQSPLRGVEVYRAASWAAGGPFHISHVNAVAGMPISQQYACGSGADTKQDARGNELACFRLDGSYDTLVVAPIMTQLDAAGGGDLYNKYPKAALDITGRYALWTSNLGGGRLDAFIAKIPAQRLATAGDTQPPSVGVNSPAAGATVSGRIALAADASDNVGVAGVEFRMDGIRLGMEVTSAPFVFDWDTTLSPNGPHVLTVVARDAAGNTATSNSLQVTVSNAVSLPLPMAQEVTWTGLVNAKPSGATLQKTAGCDGCADAGAVSVQALNAGDGYLEFEVDETNTARTVGLGRGSTATGIAEIGFGLSFSAQATVEVRESRNYKADTRYAARDKFRIAVVKSRVEYSRNGVVFYRSATPPAYPMFADASLWSSNASIKNAVITAAPKPDLSAPVVSLSSPVAGTSLTGCAVSLVAVASDDVAVAGVQFKLDGAGLGPEITTPPYAHAWNTTTAANGMHSLVAVARDIAGNVAQSAPVQVVVRNDSTTAMTSQAVEWIRTVNVAVAGSTLQKSAGCDGCADAGGFSAQTLLAGDGYFEHEVADTNTFRAAGLAHIAPQATYQAIEFGLLFTAGKYVEVRENGVYKWDLPYAVADKFRVAVAGNRVEYSRNGTVFYVSAKPPAYPLVAAASLGSAGAVIKNAVINQPSTMPILSCPS